MKDQGAKSVFILNDKEAYGLGVATDTKNSATKLGLKVAGFTAWDPKASSYEAVATKIKQSGADWIYLGGLICENGAQAGLGPQGWRAEREADGSGRLQRLHRQRACGSHGMFITVAGVPPRS